MRKTILGVLLVLALPLRAQAQGPCAPQETYRDCIDRLITAVAEIEEPEAEAFAEEAAGESASAAAEDIAETKSAPEAAPDAASSLRDFLPLFFGSLGLGGVQEQDGTLTLTFNPELLDLGPDNPLSLQAVIHDPILFAPMLAAIPESIRADRESVLEKELGDFDDVGLSLSWSRESDRFGREASQHRDLMQGVFGEIHAEAVDSAPTADTRALLDELARAPEGTREPGSPAEDPRTRADVEAETETGGAGAPPPPDPLSLTPVTADETTRQRFDRAIAAFADNMAQRQQAFVDLSRAARFYDLGDLINNQPQVVASAVYRRRAELTGPDELSAKLSFEIGFANVNGLRRHCRRAGAAQVTRSCLGSYLQRYGPTLEGSPRLTLTAEYAETDDYDFGLPNDAFTFHVGETSKTVARLAYGRYLTIQGKGTQDRRFDLEAKYEDVTGDPQRQARLVALATVTQKMTEDISASFSVLWANKPEYLGEVDEDLGARLGLKYKIDRAKAE